jgi:hypothetical protein
MVVREFERRADVDYLVEIGQAIEGNKQVFQDAARKRFPDGESGIIARGKLGNDAPGSAVQNGDPAWTLRLLRSNYRVRIFGR